jgi:hypothetical protein
LRVDCRWGICGVASTASDRSSTASRSAASNWIEVDSKSSETAPEKSERCQIRRQGYPWKFYGLTEEGREFLEDHNLLATEETLQQIYETISDKPEKMVKYENAPRPEEI